MSKYFVGILVIIVIGCCALIYPANLEQKNPETLFLTSKGLEDYQSFQKVAPKLEVLVIEIMSVVTYESYQKLIPLFRKIENVCKEDCEVLLPQNLYRSEQSFKNDILNKKQDKIINLISAQAFSMLITGKNIKRKIEKFQNIFTSASQKINLAGIPFTNYLLDQYSKTIKENVFPLMFLFSFLLILFLTRNIFNSLAIFLPALFSAGISMSFLKYYFQNINMITSIIPLICYSVNLSTSFHLFFTLLEYKTFQQTWKHKAKPVVLMIFTTSIGFFSLYSSDLHIIRQFGLVSAFFIILTNLLTLLWYNLLSHINIQFKVPQSLYFFELKSTWPLKLIILSILLALPSGYFSFKKINILTDATAYFPKKTGLKDNIDRLSSTVAGMPLIEVVLKNKDDNLLGAFEENNISGLTQSYKRLSYRDLIREMNFEYSGVRTLPNESNALKLLEGKIITPLKNKYSHQTPYRITYLGKPSNYDEYQSDLKKIKNNLNKFFPHNYTINGLYFQLMTSQNAMVTTLIKSFSLSLLIISVCTMLIYRNFKLFLLFSMINVVPIFTSFIITKFLGFSINIATVMTYSISLGIIVDSTLHLIHILDKKDMRFENFQKTVITPIVLSSCIFICSFFTFALNDFIPIKQFGVNLGCILFLGLIFDLYVLPTVFLRQTNLREVFSKKDL